MAFEIDFVAVGENSKGGDAIALRFGNLMGPRSGYVVVAIDGGTTASGKQLADYIRAFYRTDRVDTVISTHPDADHSCGLITLLDELTVGEVAMHLPWDHTDEIARLFRDRRVTDNSVREHLRSLESACELATLARRKGIPVVEPFEGIGGYGGRLQILGPSKDYYESLLPQFRCTPEARLDPAERARRAFVAELRRQLGGVASRAAESFGFETLRDTGVTSAENNSSVITLFRLDGHSLLFTGDAGISALTRAADRLSALGIAPGMISFIQVPHHGSHHNVGPSLLDRLLGPRLPFDNGTRMAFCSCPKEWKKHPSRKVLNAFRRRGAPVCLTQGRSIWYWQGDVPARPTYTSISGVPLFPEVEGEDDDE
jgi:beta-lactamase superfamily II metal-dependent hydrolase